MSALVSILIPAYNAERWIGETIRSAMAQTWPAVEVVVVDDGSTDRTLAAAQMLAGAKVKVITQVNRGASAARNAALALAQGDYIQWLDSDDLLAPDKIEQQLRSADEGPAGYTLLSSAFGEFLAHPRNAVFRPTVLWQDLTPIDFLLHKFIGNVWMSPGTWLAGRALVEGAGPWDQRLSLDDDGEYFSRLISKASTIRFVPKSRMYYRRGSPVSLSRSVSDRACESLLLSLQLCIGHLQALENSERTRGAGVRLLQNWVDNSDCFCPDSLARFEHANSLAHELGGELSAHRLSWKYVPVKALLGWKAARRARRALSNLKLAISVRLDELAADRIGSRLKLSADNRHCVGCGEQ